MPTAQSIIKAAQVTLQDTAGVRWPASELVEYLNEARRATIVKRPDSYSTTTSVVPVAGARQSLPSAAVALMDITRNTSGTKRAITKVDMTLLDAVNRDWQSATGVSEFVHYIYDPREPRVFFLYPPATGGSGSVELIHSQFPADISAPSGDGKAYTTVSGDISMTDEWVIPLLNYVLAKAYSKDVEYGGNAALATAYMAAFDALIGAQLQSAQAVAPQK